MKYFPLVWAMLWRSKARTWLTFLSIMVAFLLFGLLQSVVTAFDAGVRLAADDQLIVSYKQGLTKLLPLAYRARIEQVEGVKAVDNLMFMGVYYQDPKNQFPTLAVDAGNFGRFDDRLTVSEETARAFREVKFGAVAGRHLAEKYGWKVGDRLPMKGGQPNKNGSFDWEFQLVGLYDTNAERLGQNFPAENLFVRFDYYNELTPYPNHVLMFPVKVADVKQVAAVAKAIDREFQNSEFETKTVTEAEFQRGFVKQFGDIGLMMSGILAAVFFTLLLVSGNTMMQAFRDRMPELAVLKTIGFTDRGVAALVVAESLLLCIGAAAAGVGLAALVIPPIRDAMAQFLAGLSMENSTLLLAAAIATGIGLVSALIPAWRSARLSVIDTLTVR